VYIDAAYVLNATIQNAQIANEAVDDSKIASLNVGKLTAGSINVDDYIQSTDYVEGEEGWKIHGNGFAEFGAADIRGQLTAAQIDSRGLTIRTAAGAVILNAGTSEFVGNVTGTVNGTDASTLVTTANDAATAAGAAQDAADDALGVLADIASDNVLTPGEKPTIITDYGVITAEQAGIDAQATAYDITTQKTAYDNAVTALTTHLDTLTTPVAWNDLSDNTDIVGTTFRTKFTDVYTTRQALLNAISAAAKVLADTAQDTADDAADAADAAQTAASNALTGLTTKLNSDARNVLAGEGGLAVGTLEWNSSGVRTSGYGVGFSANGLAAYNDAGVATFVLDGDTGNATFAGELSAATGSFAGELSAATGTFTGSLSAATGSFSGAVSASTLSADSMDVARRNILELGGLTIPSSTILGFFESGKGGSEFYPAGTVFTRQINRLVRTNTTDVFYSTNNFIRQPFSCTVFPFGGATFSGGDGVFNIKVDAEVLVNRRYSIGGATSVDENQVFIYVRQYVVTNVSSTFTSFTLPTQLQWKLSRA
jgi:hypothetical protein